MARAMTTFCDRCGKPVADEPEDGRNKLARFDKDYHGTKIDLCRDCAKEFITWLENGTSSAPIGYTTKARPCTHQIPCAGAGCSGYELVKIG